MFRLDTKIAIVTGGGSGIGKAISVLFAQQGATVCIIDVNEESKTVANEINSENNKAFFYKCNIANQQEVISVVKKIISEHSTIDILINNAGIAHIGTAENTSAEDFEKLLNVNVKGIYNCLHEVIPFMKEKGRSEERRVGKE